MASKRYPKLSGDSLANSLIREAKAETYGRRKGQRKFLPNAQSVASLRRKLKRPVRRSKNEVTWALGIAGIGEGPEDLSRKYAGIPLFR